MVAKVTRVHCVLTVLMIFESFASSSNNQLSRRTLPSCGRLLIGLTSQCTNPKQSKLEYCCGALKAWNDGLCWCEKNAFNAASNLAMDYYAFLFRVEKCNLTEVFHPEISLPVARKENMMSTCPTFESLPSTDRSETCEPNISSVRLRKKRLEYLNRLSREDVELRSDITSWSERIDSLLSPGASLFSIGMSFLFPRRNIKLYLLSRSTLSRGPLWKGIIDTETLFWRSANIVSYSAAHVVGQYSFGKLEFVTFERCSPRIKEVYSQEEESVRLHKQFVYFEPTDRNFWRAHHSPGRWCSSIYRYCPKALFPFENKTTCIEFFRRSWTKEHITCTRGTYKHPVLALHGDTSSCRAMYLELASVDPSYCRFLGETGIGLCRKSGCLPEEYSDVFREGNPRYESTVGYTCSNRTCFENWPYGEETSERKA